MTTLHSILELLLIQVGVGLLGFVVSWFTSEAEARTEQSSPFFAGLMAFCRGVGIDLPKILGGLRDMLQAMLQQHPAQKAAARRAAIRRNERGFGGLAVLAWAGLVAIVAGLAMMASCAALTSAEKPACQVISFIDNDVCPYVTLEYRDDAGVARKEAYLREDLIAGARFEAAARKARSGAGGSKPAGQ